jgi:hypothetical protein
MSTAGKAIAVTVVAIAAIAVWRTARVREAPPPSTADGAAAALGTKPGGEVGSTVPQSAQLRDSIEQQVDRLTDRRGQTRGDTAAGAGAGGGDQNGRMAALAARRRESARHRAATTDGSMDDAAEDDPDAAATSAEELAATKQKALTDPDPEERIDAVGSLDLFDDANVIPILQTVLRDHEPEVRIAALDKLNDLNEPPVDVIATGMQDPSAAVRERTVQILSGLDDEHAQALVRDARNDPDEDVRTTAELYAEDPDLVNSDSDSDGQ